MAFNFKKNLLIIMLLIIVILVTIVYVNIQNIKETFISNRIDPNNIIPERKQHVKFISKLVFSQRSYRKSSLLSTSKY